MNVQSLCKLLLIALAGTMPVACDDTYGDTAYRLNDMYALISLSEDTLPKAYRLGGSSADAARSVAMFSDHGFVSAGYVTGDSDLNGDQAIEGIYPESSFGYGGSDIFISKFDDSSVWQWSTRLGGAGSDTANGVAVDSSGNILIAATVSSNADLNGDGDMTDASPVPEIPSGVNGGLDAVILKFSPSGRFLWAKRLGGTSDDGGCAVAVDRWNNVIVGGTVNGSADLNGDGVIGGPYETQSGAYGGIDGFVSKFDSNGTHLWSKRMGGAGSDSVNGVAVDPSGNVIAAVTVSGSADLNGDGDTTDSAETPSAVNGGDDAVVVKLGAGGNYLWAKRIGGSYADAANAVVADSKGHVIVAGKVNGTADLNGDGSISLFAETGYFGIDSDDPFVSAFDTAGTFLWCKRMGGDKPDSATSLAITPSDAVVVGGIVNGPADLDGDGNSSGTSAEINCFGNDNSDVFITMYDSSGNFMNVSRRLGGDFDDFCWGIAVDTRDNLLVSGSDSVLIAGSIFGSGTLAGDGTVHPDYPDTIYMGSVYASPTGGTDDVFVSRLYMSSWMSQRVILK